MMTRDFPHIVKRQPLLEMNKYSEPVRGEPTPHRALVSFQSKTRQTPNGDEFVSTVQITFPSPVNVHYDDLFVFVDGFGQAHEWNPRDIRHLTGITGQMTETVVYA